MRNKEAWYKMNLDNFLVSIRAVNNIKRTTSKIELKELVDKGLFEVRGKGKGTRYVLSMTIKRTKGDKKTLQNEMKGIGIVYQDKYTVEEALQLLKIPWEWYDPSKDCDVVIAKHEDLNSKDVNFNLIDLSEDDVFKKVSNLLNHGMAHNREPLFKFKEDINNSIS